VWDYFVRGRRRFQELPLAAFAQRFRPPA